MANRWSVLLGVLMACLMVCCPAGAGAEVRRATPSEGGMVSLDFRDIELPDLIQTVSELTGKNFLYDETVRGKVTIISPDSVSLDEAYQLFLSVLNVKGYTVVPSGKTNKILPLKNAKESNLPTVIRGGRTAEQFVTRLVRLDNIDAAELANTVLSPLIPKTSSIVAYPPSNTLIITDSAANIERLMRIVRELDVPSSLDLLEIFRLENADAEDVARLCTEVITQVSSAPQRRKGAANVKAAGDREASKVLAYPRTNALVAMASAENLATIRELVAELDQKPARERSHINVYYLEHADAESLAKTLNEILTGIRSRARTAAGAAKPGQAPAPVASESVSITADKPTNSLVINATPEDYEVLQGIIGQLDIKRKQVFVEALILELSMDATRDLGASIAGFIPTSDEGVVYGGMNQAAPGLGVLAPGDNGVPSLLTQSIQGVLAGGLFNMVTVTAPDGTQVSVPAVSALINLSKTDSDVNILSAPRLLTSDNEEAEIVVGSNVPIITSRLTDTGGGAGLAQSVSIERKDVALTLRFTPQITEGDRVRLNVYQEITDIVAESSQQAVGDVNEVGPTLTKRLLRNTVLAENGRTVVLGGLISSNLQQSVTKVPFLGDIPVLGWLFKRKGTTEKKVNLLIFITPRIIKDSADLAMVTRDAKGDMDRFRSERMRPPLAESGVEAELLHIPAAPGE